MSQQIHPFIDQIYAHCKDMNKPIFIRKKNELTFTKISLKTLSEMGESENIAEVLVCLEEDLPEYEYLGDSGISNQKPITNFKELSDNFINTFWLVDITKPIPACTLDTTGWYPINYKHVCNAGLVYKDKESALIKARYILSLLGIQTT